MGAETNCVVKERAFKLLERNKELEAEVSRLTEENEEFKRYVAERDIRIVELMEENEKLKADRSDAIKDLVNAEERIDQLKADNAALLRGSVASELETRISAIEKWAEEISKRTATRVKDRFKPGGEGNG